MNALVRKELRLLRPVWTAALALTAAPAAFLAGGFQVDAWSFLFFGLAVLLLGLSPFGREFHAGSFSLLLAQPVPRPRLWRVKFGLVLTAFLSVLALWALICCLTPAAAPSDRWEDFGGGAGFGLAFLAGGLWTTLLLRQVTAAFWLSLLIPALIALWVEKLTQNQPAPVPVWSMVLAWVLYAVAGLVWARRLWERAEDVPSTGGTVSTPAWLGLGGREATRPRRSGHRPLGALVRQELQFHQVTFMLAAGLLVLHLVSLALRKVAPAGASALEWPFPLLWLGELWLAVPWLMGCAAVAEERKFRTMETHLCLPVARRRLFAVKFATVLGWGMLLGGGLCWVLESVGCLMGVPSGLLEHAFEVRALMGLTGMAAAIGVVSFYASTGTRHLLAALGTAVILGLVGVGLAALALAPERVLGFAPWRGPLACWLGGPVLLGTIVTLAYGNYKRLLEGGRVWRRNGLVLGVVLAAGSVVTSLVYHRTWEWLLPLEPRHGPAQLSGPGRAKLEHAGAHLFLLLPDGRLWVSRNVPRELLGWMAVPERGAFVGDSNWVDIAHAFYKPFGLEAIGLQSDGSLWRMQPSPFPFRADPSPPIVPQRIGAGSDWRSLAAGGSHLLALKTDGSLWGWGDNSQGQLGEGPNQFSNGPVRLGTDSDWVAVFASGSTSAGLKRDGSLWKWGGLFHRVDGTVTLRTTLAPLRSSLPGTNLVSLQSHAGCDLGLYADGSVVAVGHLPSGLFGADDDGPPVRTPWRYVATPVRVGGKTGWHELVLDGSLGGLVGIRRDGSLWKQEDLWAVPHRKAGRFSKVSDHSDWLTVTVEQHSALVALAADGTLFGWAWPGRWGRALLAPTRRPLWSVNLFAVSE